MCFLDELDFVMKVKSKRRNYFLEAFNNFDAFGSLYSYLRSEGYSIGMMSPTGIIRRRTGKCADENLERKNYVVNFTDEMDKINIERTTLLTVMRNPGNRVPTWTGPTLLRILRNITTSRSKER